VGVGACVKDMGFEWYCMVRIFRGLRRVGVM
jgi:hypothetical protein